MNKILATLTGTCLLGLSVEGQNLILNGGFESPVVPANTRTQGTVPDSWVGNEHSFYNSNFIINGSISFFYVGYPLPHSGQQYSELGQAAVLSQAFNVNDPGIYTIKWFDNGPGPAGLGTYSVTLLDSLSSSVLSKTLDATSPLGLWTQHSIQVPLAPGTYTLTFTNVYVGLGIAPELIDDVSVEASAVDQACPCTGPSSGGTWKNHGQYVACVAHAAESALNSGSISEDDRDALVETAAQSTCGKN